MTPSSQPPRPSSTDDTSVARLRKGSRISGGVYLVQEANFKQTRNSKYFIQLTLRDKTGSIRAVRWEATPEMFNSFTTEDFLRIDGRVEEFQQNLQVVVDAFARLPPEDVDHENFLPASRRDLNEMERELLEAIASIEDPHIRKLLTLFVEDPEVRSGLLRCPAGKTLHHAVLGGLLEHILSLVGVARLVVKNYPALNADILTAAAFLHDIGKIHELSYQRSFSYTDEGQLVGHIGIGLLMLREKAKAIPDFPKDLLYHLEHILVSHHGLPEHGALKLPMTAEAITFHYLDNLDAKLSMLESLREELARTQEMTDADRRWTDYKPPLGRRIFFPE